MKKAIIIMGSIIVIIAIASIFSYKFIKQTISPVSEAIYAVPIDAAFVFQTGNFYEVIRKTEHESEMWKELITIPDMLVLNKKLAFLDSLFRLNSKSKEFIKNRSAIISGHLVGEERLEYLFVLALPTSTSIDDVNTLINDQLAGKAASRVRNYSDVDIYDVQFSLTRDLNFSYAVKEGMFLLSFSSIILETSIRQLDTKISLLNDKGYKKVQKTAGQNVDATLFINYKEFPKMMLFSSNKKHKDDVRAFRNFADWTELDVSIKKDALLLNGFTFTNDSSYNYLNIFLKQTPQIISFSEILPGNTTAFIALGLSNLGRFNSEYRKYLEFTGQTASYMKELSKIKKESGIEIEKMLYPLIDKEIGVVFTDVAEPEDINSNAFAIIKTVNKTQAEEEFWKLLSGYATNNNVKESSLKENYNLDDQTSFVIYRMPYPQLMKKLFGSVFSKVDAGFFTFIDNYLVFGKSKKALGDFIHYKILQKTLGDDKNYKQFTENMTSKSNFYFYSNIARSSVLWASFFNEEIGKIITDNTATFQKFQAVAFQFYSMNNMLYNNIYAKHNPVYKDEPRTVWETRIDTVTTFRPVLIDNPSTDEKCIFVQDVNNTAYLINSVGRVLWKIDIKEKIMSNIYQLDYFKNKKLQFLFSTKNYIHVVDILGNEVKQFPLKLRAPASNGVSLVEFDKKRNYRFFIAGEDKKIYAYSKEGNVLKDWKFKGTDNLVKSEIQFFEMNKKDYVVFSDSRRTYITDRKGSVKIKPEKDFVRSAHNIFYLKSDKKETYILTTDSAGTVKMISSEGVVSSMPFTTLSSGHYFVFSDINNDGREEYIFADKKVVEMYKENKTKTFSRMLEDVVTEKPVMFNFTKKTHKLGVVCGNSNKIYLLNSNGSLYNGFPLVGKTMFSIGYFTKENNNFNLVVGSNDHFIYNYEIK